MWKKGPLIPKDQPTIPNPISHATFESNFVSMMDSEPPLKAFPIPNLAPSILIFSPSQDQQCDSSNQILDLEGLMGGVANLGRDVRIQSDVIHVLDNQTIVEEALMARKVNVVVPILGKGPLCDISNRDSSLPTPILTKK